MTGAEPGTDTTASVASVVFGSFDAERQWRPDDIATLPSVPDPQAARVVAGLDQVLAAVCDSADLLVTAEPLPPALTQVLAGVGLAVRHRAVRGAPDSSVEDRLAAAAGDFHALRGLRARPYALTAKAVTACDALSLTLDLRDADLVASLNSKVFSNDLVSARDLAGAACRVRSAADLRAAAADLPIVLKDPFGVAGLGCLRVTEPRALERLARHLDRQSARGRRIDMLVQPWYPPAHDFSAHFVVGSDGTLTPVGLCETRNDGFAYQASRPMPEALAQRLARYGYQETVTEIAAAMAEMGYRGPLCVDSLLARDGTLVPVLEINARMSMGLVALSVRRLVRQSVVVRQRTVLPRDALSFERLVTALSERHLLATRERPGVLPLAAAPLVRPRGRLVYALVGDHADAHDAELDRVLDALGMLSPGDIRAA